MSRLFDAPLWHLFRTLAMRQFFVNASDLNAESLRTRRRPIPGYAAQALQREIDQLNALVDEYRRRSFEAEYKLWQLEKEGRP